MTGKSNNADFHIGVSHPLHRESDAGGPPVEHSKLVLVSELAGYQLDLVLAQILAASGRLKAIVVRLGPGYVVMEIEVTESHSGAQPKRWRPRVDSEDRSPFRRELATWSDADPVGSLRDYVRSKLGECARVWWWEEPARRRK